MRGLIKATHYYSTLQARADWAQLADYAAANGHADDAARLAPPDSAGHRTIDKRIDALTAVLGIDVPFYVWQEQQEVTA